MLLDGKRARAMPQTMQTDMTILQDFTGAAPAGVGGYCAAGGRAMFLGHVRDSVLFVTPHHSKN